MQSSKYKIIVILSTLIVVVSAMITAYTLYHEYDENQYRLHKAYSDVHRTYRETLKETTAFYHTRADASLRSEGVLNAFRARNHEELYRLIRPRWEIMQNENPWLSVMQFHNSDGTSLLRMHQPGVYGDRIADHREMVAYAHQTQQAVSGFEEGRQGLAFRMLVPVFDQGIYIGALEFGISTPYFTDKIRRFSGYNAFFFVRKEALGMFGRVGKSIEIGDFLGIDIPQMYRPFIQKYAQSHTVVENALLVHESKTYQVNILKVTDYLEKQVAAVMFIQPVNDFKTHVRHMIVATGLIALGLILVIGIIVDRVYSYMQNKMNFQQRYSQMILDSVPTPVIVTDGAHLMAANTSFLNYFHYENIEAFKSEHECVCEYFEAGDTDEYLMPLHDDQRWTEYMLEHPLKIHKAKITIQGLTTIFEVRISVLKADDDTRFVVIFNDISTMQMQTMSDPLTKIPNRLHFSMVYQHVIDLAHRGDHRLGIVFFDIDHFKDVNDRFGHLVGDTVLKEIASVVREHIRKSDIVARWGGEEFVLLLPDTDLEEAARVAEMLRNLIAHNYFEEAGTVTCSFGVAALEENEDGEHLLNRADQLLYEAKNAGRNRVIY